MIDPDEAFEEANGEPDLNDPVINGMIDAIVAGVRYAHPEAADEVEEMVRKYPGGPPDEEEIKLFHLILQSSDDPDHVKSFGVSSAEEFVQGLVNNVVLLTMSVGKEAAMQALQHVWRSAQNGAGVARLERANRTYLNAERAKEMRLMELEFGS